MSLSDKVDITTSIKDFISLCLGRGYFEKRPIPPHIAEILLLKTKNNPDYGFHIEVPSELNDLSEPVLWDYKFWVISHERDQRQKRYSENQRKLRFIAEANVKLVANAIEEYCGMRGDICRVTAHGLVHGGKILKIRAVGVKRIYKTIEEIP